MINGTVCNMSEVMDKLILFARVMSATVAEGGGTFEPKLDLVGEYRSISLENEDGNKTKVCICYDVKETETDSIVRFISLIPMWDDDLINMDFAELFRKYCIRKGSGDFTSIAGKSLNALREEYKKGDTVRVERTYELIEQQN